MLTYRTDTQPVGIFDSGVGGLSVLQEITKLLPLENILYYADSGNCPYGPRPAQEIRHLAENAAAFLLEKGAKALVVACNTASTAAVAYLRQLWPQVPIVGMVPAVKPAASLSQSGVIGVLSTQATSRATALHEVIDRFAHEVRVLIAAPPGLVEKVEAGEIASLETLALLEEYLEPMLKEKMDVLVLGCTHFPFLRPALAQVLGPAVQIIDSGEAVARQTRRVLEQSGGLNPNISVKPAEIIFYTSGDPAQVGPVIARLLNYSQPPIIQPG